MTDIAQTPDQQVQAPGQQAPAAPAAPAEDWKSRYDGLVKKTEQLVGEKRTLETELATLRTQIEQLNGQLSLKDVEKTAAVGERDKQLQAYVQQVTQAEAELKRLKALELKLQVANELGDPSLLKIAQHIPDLADPEALKVVMKDFAGFVSERVQAREKQLLAGTGVIGGVVQTTPAKPQSDSEWRAQIAEIPFSEPEKRRRALDDYGKWLQEQNTRR